MKITYQNKVEAILLPTNHTNKQKNKFVSCSKALLMNPFYLKTFRKLRYLYKFPFQKIVTRVNWCRVKISYLLHDLICDNITIGWFLVKVGQKIQFWNPPSQILTKFGPNVPVYKIWQTAKFQHPIPIGSKVMVIWNLVHFTLFAPHSHHFGF